MTTVKDIAKIIATKYEMSNVEAEIFMQMIVEVINDGLLQDRQVKIKGFGTFKLQAVKERSSVNVNTGEKVVIAEHDKISFVPDAVMKDLINKPFAQFETVVVEDDSPLLKGNIDADSIVTNTEDDEPQEIEKLEQDPEQTESNLHETYIEQDGEGTTGAQTTVAEKVEPAKVEDSSTLQQTPTSTKEVEDTVATDHLTKREENEFTNSSEHENGRMESNNVCKKIFAKEEEDKVTDITDDYKTEESGSEQEKCVLPYPRCKNIFIYYGILINVIVAVIAFSLGYMASSQGWFSFEEKDTAPRQVTKKVPVKKVVMKQATPPTVNLSTDSVKATSESTSDKETNMQGNTPTKTAQETAQKAKSETIEKDVVMHDFDSDIRVKTGAYYIIGTEKVITVREGQSLASISRQCLGDGMECYIEAYNNIRTVKKGDKIKIPKLKLKKKVIRK